MAKPTIEPRDGIPYLSWTENGKRWRRSLGKITPSAAEKIRSAKEAELEHGIRILPRLQTVRTFLESYYDWYEAEHPTTIGKLKSETKRFIEHFGSRPIDTIKPFEIDIWKASRLRDDEAAPETVGKEIRRVKAAFKRGVDWKEIDINPAEKIKAPRGVRDVAVEFYTPAELKLLYKANPNRSSLWQFIVNTGMRRGEAAKCQKSDIHQYPKERRLRIESLDAMVRTKSGKMREVPLNKSAEAALKKLPDRVAGCHPDTLSDWFAEDAAAAGIGGTLHRLRHTFCAHLAMAGVPLRRIQILAGHADYKTTEIYAHLCPSGASREVNKIRL